MLMLQRRASAVRQSWLHHVAGSVFPAHLYSSSVSQREDGASADATNSPSSGSTRYRPNEPAYLTMGADNKHYKDYFAKLRRKHLKYHGTKHPMQVSWDHSFDYGLEVMRRHNATLPVLVGQTIMCKVMAVDPYRDIVWFDTGYKFPAKFHKRHINLEDVVATKDGPLPQDAPPKEEWEVGDVVYFVIEDLHTPFDEMQLRPLSRGVGMHRVKDVMDELAMKHARQEVVMGRVLNEMQRGYAVGIAGVVAFCPLNACSPLTARRIGVLQPFYVKSMPQPGSDRNAVVLEDAKIARTIRRVSQPPTWGNPNRGGLPFGAVPPPPPLFGR